MPQHQTDANQKHQMLEGVQNVEVAPVKRYIGGDVLPGNDGEKIEIEPPHEQEAEINRAQPESLSVRDVVWPQSQSSHQGDQMQKQDYVTDERVGNALLEKDFKVGP